MASVAAAFFVERVHALHRRRLADDAVVAVAHRQGLGPRRRAGAAAPARTSEVFSTASAASAASRFKYSSSAALKLPRLRVEHLHHADDVAVAIAQRRRHEAARAISGLAIDLAKEAPVALGRRQVEDLPRGGDGAGDALPDLEPDLLELGQVRRAREQLARLRIDEVERAAIGAERLGDLGDHPVEQLVEIDLALQERPHRQEHVRLLRHRILADPFWIKRAMVAEGRPWCTPPAAQAAVRAARGASVIDEPLARRRRRGKRARVAASMRAICQSSCVGSWWKSTSPPTPAASARRAPSSAVEWPQPRRAAYSSTVYCAS